MLAVPGLRRAASDPCLADGVLPGPLSRDRRTGELNLAARQQSALRRIGLLATELTLRWASNCAEPTLQLKDKTIDIAAEAISYIGER